MEFNDDQIYARVQRAFKAPADVPSNFLSRVMADVDQYERRSSTPLPVLPFWAPRWAFPALIAVSLVIFGWMARLSTEVPTPTVDSYLVQDNSDGAIGTLVQSETTEDSDVLESVVGTI